MPITNKASSTPGAAISFITAGVVMAIPSAVWYMLFSPAGVGKFLRIGLFFLGLAFLGIGVAIGSIARAALKAEISYTTATADRGATTA